MPRIASIESGFYRIALPEVLTDSMHGEMRDFELNTVRVRDADGAEGVGYTFTVGRNGGAIDSILTREFPDILANEEADHIERLWNKAWWALHYGGRGGPTVLGALGLRHGPVGPEGQARRSPPVEATSAASIPRCRATRAASIWTCPSDKLLRQTDDNLGKGFPRHQDEGRPQAPRRGRGARCRPCASIWARASRSWSTPT
jgi:hypothetical protein